jgi:hypothetical protein
MPVGALGRRDVGTPVGSDVGTPVGMTLVGTDVGRLVGTDVGRDVGVGVARLPVDGVRVERVVGFVVAVCFPGVLVVVGDEKPSGSLYRHQPAGGRVSPADADGPGDGSAGASA